jgi:hypothetical protein
MDRNTDVLGVQLYFRFTHEFAFIPNPSPWEEGRERARVRAAPDLTVETILQFSNAE